MACEECKLEKMTHSPEVPLCEDCYYKFFSDETDFEMAKIAMAMDDIDPDFVLEHDTAKVTPSKITYHGYNGTISQSPITFSADGPILEFKVDGTVLVHGHESNDPLTIGTAMLEWAEKYVFRRD